MEMKHTPTPWVADFHGHIMAHDRTTNVASTWTTPDLNYRDGRPYKANAAFIVRACNAHDVLVRALEDAILAIQFPAGEGKQDVINAVLINGCTALKLAKGE